LVAVGLLVAGLAAAVAVLGLRIGGDQMAVVQPAVGMSWAWLGLMIAAAASVKRVTQPRPAGGPVGSVRTVSRMSPRARSAALVAAGVMTVTVAGQVAVMLVSVRDDLPRASTTDPAVLPLLATLETTDAWSGRVAVLTERDREPFTVVVSVMSTDGTSMLVDGPHRHGADDWWADPGASAHA